MNDLMSKFKRRNFLYAAIWLCSLVFKACSSGEVPIPEEPPTYEEPSVKPSDAVKVVTMSADNILSGNGNSRTSFTLEEDKLKFAWAEGDKIGVCPSSGTQIAFAIKSGAGENSAIFDGGAWALRNTETYAAYYPYNQENATASNTALSFSYEGQCQTGNASLDHLGTHDLMVANATTADGDKLNFQFKHLNSVAQMRLSVPVAATFKKLSVRCDEEEIFAKTVNLDLSGETYVWSATEMTGQLQMSLSEISSTEEMKELVFYMMLPPVDMAGKTIYVELQSSQNRIYQGLLAPTTMVAGYAYSFGATLVDVTVSTMVSSPSFVTSDTEI